MTAVERGRGRRPTIVVALALVLATVLIAVLVEPFTPIWGGPESPVWVDTLGIICGVISLLGGTWLIVRGRPETERAAYYVGACFGVLGLVIPLWFGLFLLVNVLALVLTLPYAVGIVGLVIRLRRP